MIDEDKNGQTNVLIGDFGMSKYQENPNQMTKTVCGTESYMAPEIL